MLRYKVCLLNVSKYKVKGLLLRESLLLQGTRFRQEFTRFRWSNYCGVSIMCNDIEHLRDTANERHQL